jgi:hypothetical protein
VFPVNVTQRDYRFGADLLGIGRTHPADPNTGNVQFLARRRIARPAKNMPRNNRKGRNPGNGAAQKLTTRYRCLLHSSTPNSVES